MDYPKVEIKADGAFGQVFIDGKKIAGVNGLRYEHNCNQCPKLYLEINTPNLSIDANLIPELPEVYKSFYVARRSVDGKVSTDYANKENQNQESISQ